MNRTFLIQPRDPLLLRDGRPFSADAGSRARSLEWPLPLTIAGAVRTHIGESLSFDWTTDGPDRARSIKLVGALPVMRPVTGPAQVCVPKPADAFFFDADTPTDSRWMCLRPMPSGDGVSLPGEGLRPVEVDADAKPTPKQPYWTLDKAIEWLSSSSHSAFSPRGMDAPESESRIHVSIDPETGSGVDGALFSTDMRVIADVPAPKKGVGRPGQAILCRIDSCEVWEPADSFLSLGGERRIAYVAPCNDTVQWPSASDSSSLVDKLVGATAVRIQLVTPALFSGGWRPDWLDKNGVGEVPGLSGVKLRLAGAVCGRPVAVSGWNMDRSNNRTPGPKPARYAAPAGAVYFFEVVNGHVDHEWASKAFLNSVSDLEADRADGWGVALPGIWEPNTAAGR